MNCSERSYSDLPYPTVPGLSRAVAFDGWGSAATAAAQQQPIGDCIAGHQRFGDIMNHVKHNIKRLPDFLKQNRRHFDEGGALQPLAEFEKTYAMAEERAPQRPRRNTKAG